MPLYSGQGSLNIISGKFKEKQLVRFFFNHHEVKVPIRAHVKLQKLISGAESKLHAISQLISYPRIKGY
jgi:hypothetical protein